MRMRREEIKREREEEKERYDTAEHFSNSFNSFSFANSNRLTLVEGLSAIRLVILDDTSPARTWIAPRRSSESTLSNTKCHFQPMQRISLHTSTIYLSLNLIYYRSIVSDKCQKSKSTSAKIENPSFDDIRMSHPYIHPMASTDRHTDRDRTYTDIHVHTHMYIHTYIHMYGWRPLCECG